MSSAALCSLYDVQLGPEWANVSLSCGTFVTEDIFEAVSHLVISELKARFLGANEDERACILFEDIFDHLNRIAPLDCFFGPHIGNASDFGYWRLPNDQASLCAHAIDLDGKRRYFKYDDVTDTYTEELLAGDLLPYHIPATMAFDTEEINTALESIDDPILADTVRTYIIFLERMVSPSLYV